MKKIITLAGQSQRFLDEGFPIKPLIEIDNKMIIEYVVDSIKEVSDIDYSNYIFVIKDIDNMLYNIEHVLKTKFMNCQVVEIPSHRDGPVYTILNSISHLSDKDDNEEILISYCDLYINWNIENFLTFVRDRSDDGSIVSHTGFHPHRIKNKYFAYMRVDGDDLLEIQEKMPFTSTPDSEYASGGIYYFKNIGIMKKYFNDLIDKNIRVNNEFYVTMVYNQMVRDGLSVSHFDSQNYVCLGTPLDVKTFIYSKFLLDHYSVGNINDIVTYFQTHYYLN